MPGFNSEKIESLEWDLTRWRPDPDAPDLTDEERERRRRLADLTWSGVIPEPSDDQIEAFFYAAMGDIRLEQMERIEAMIEQQREKRLEHWRSEHPDADADPDRDTLDNLDLPASLLRTETAWFAAGQRDIREKARLRTVHELAEFCSNQPGADVLGELPWRALQHFLGWVTGQFRPETLAAAMNA